MSFLYIHSNECLKIVFVSLFFAVYPDKHRELAVYHKPVTSLADDAPDRIRHIQSRGTELPVSGRDTSPQRVEGITHTEKDVCAQLFGERRAEEERKQ